MAVYTSAASATVVSFSTRETRSRRVPPCVRAARANGAPAAELTVRHPPPLGSLSAVRRRIYGQRLDLAALRTFYDARNGAHEPFYFYDPYETNPKFSYDPTGAAVTGRYTVRFNTESTAR